MIPFVLTVCSLLLSITGATSATVANGDSITSSCYIVNDQNYCFYSDGAVLSWNEAREFCERRNSTVPIITDEDIDNVFQQLVTDSYSVIQNRSVWIDAHARHVQINDSWHWIDGRQSDLRRTNDDNRYWSATIGVTQPYNDTQHHEVKLFVNSSWTENRGYICQYHSVTLVNESCSPEWKIYNDSFVNNIERVIHATARTLQQCQYACVFYPRCVAVVWPACYMYTRFDTDQLINHSDHTVYELVKRCNVTPVTSCDDGLVHKSTCYKIHRERVDWFTAVNRCLSYNASLAVFDDDMLTYFAASLLIQTGPLWIGLIRSWWTWPDADDADVLYNKFNVNYSTEFPTAPDNPPPYPNSGYDCVVARQDWTVVNCSQKHHVVCQGDVHFTSKTTTSTAGTTNPYSDVNTYASSLSDVHFTSKTTTSTAGTTYPYSDVNTYASSLSGSSPPVSSTVENEALIAGVVVAFVVVVLIVVVVVVVVLRRCRRRPSNRGWSTASVIYHKSMTSALNESFQLPERTDDVTAQTDVEYAYIVPAATPGQQAPAETDSEAASQAHNGHDNHINGVHANPQP